jgi:outer membrane receptor protein involved in Fe transport
MKFFFFSCLFTLIGFITAAQTTTRSGIRASIIFDESNDPVGFATFRVFKEADSTLVAGSITNESGKVSVNTAPGIYYALVEFVGYESKVIRNIDVGSSMVELGQITLKEQAEILEEIEITADKGQTVYGIDKKVYNVGSDLSNIANNASDILDNLPSIQVDGDGNVSLRGSENVRILVDGKPSGLVGVGSVNALRNLQGDLIERIEVITNPSSRYDAEGEAGIINIILKKKKDPGFNASFSANTGYPNNHGIAATINKRQNKVNFFLNGGLNYRRSPGNGSNEQTFFEEDTTFSFISDRQQLRGGISGNVRLGTDIYLNSNTTLTLAGLYSKSDQDNEVDINYRDFDEEGTLVQEIQREQDENEIDENIELDVSLIRTFQKKGQKFTTDFKWTDNRDIEAAEIVEDNFTNPDASLVQRTSNTENQQSLLIQSDYVHPLADVGQVETGYRFTNRIIDNDFLVEELNDDQYEPIEGFDNTYQYNEWIYAAYLQGLYRMGPYALQAGIRMEHTDILTTSEETDETVVQQYTNFFPSVFLKRDFSKESSVKISYSRRISRPRFRLLLPFSNFSDARNFRQGNPNLRPEFTDAAELEHVRNGKKFSFQQSVYFRNRSNTIQRIQFIDSSNVNAEFPVTIAVPVNLGTENSVGYELSFSYDLLSWWSFNVNSNIFYSRLTSDFDEDNITIGTIVWEVNVDEQNLNYSAFNWNSRLTSRMSLPGGTKFQTSFRYRAPTNTAQGRRLAFYTIDVGLSKEILKGKGNLSFAIQDLLNSRVWRQEINDADFVSSREFQWRERQFLLTFNYYINKKPRPQRDNGWGGGDDF